MSRFTSHAFYELHKGDAEFWKSPNATEDPDTHKRAAADASLLNVGFTKKYGTNT